MSASTTTRHPEPTPQPNQTPTAQRIVGIGASAGGLAPLEEFLRHTPPASGMAYIVVQHLDPNRKALLAELLQRATRMPVQEAQQGMRIEPDHVYVIPPNEDLRVADGRLALSAPAEPRGLRLPVDVLFSSLAGSLGRRAIAVVLSGMGTDGTLGLQAIKAVGGLSVAQDPDTAQFDSMPRHAISAGLVDVIDVAAALPTRILAYVGGVKRPPAAPPETDSTTHETALPHDRIVELLHERTRHDFGLYKTSTLRRRTERRMAIHGINSADDYAAYLANNPQEIDLLFKELLIGVTSFFRDALVWEHLATVALPDFLARRTPGDPLRAWSVGCSTGEEAYSLAIVFTEVVEHLATAPPFTLQIFASDVSPDAIAAGRRGQFPLAIQQSMSEQRLSRFFTKHESHYQINSTIRDMVLFAQHDVVLDPPFTRLDLILCRNLLIYFTAELQRRLLPLFHYALRPDGLLLLGGSETTGRFGHLFQPLQSKLRIYQREGSAIVGQRELLTSHPLPKRVHEEAIMTPAVTSQAPGDNLKTAADDVLLQVYAPAAVVVTASGDIVYISGRTGRYLEPAAGKANWNIAAMARAGLREALEPALKQAAAGSEPLHLHGVDVTGPDGLLRLDVTVQALQEPAALHGLIMIVFREISLNLDPAAGGALVPAERERLRNALDEIHRLREEAQASRSALQSANEQLQSTNEELQSTNEELQSANEELTTSKEEMQSMNEELQTINGELQTKLDDLALAQSDMQNVLNSVEIAILFLDNELNVRRYTDRASTVVSLRDSDVGRPLSDLTTSLQYPTLTEDARATLRTLRPTEKQIPSNDDRWFSIRIMPYRRLNNLIDGVVITMFDITATKKLEAALRQSAED
ncbi:MAG: PAS domain-containing protein [Gammaproteobacteria bacterium]|nr:PAS domain-containing protein [Gammaproteobacteria bacterium]